MATMREQVRQAIDWHIRGAASREHDVLYERLEVWRDGSLQWVASANSNERTIDERNESQNAVPVPTLAVVGSGNIACNCEWCSPPDGVDPTPVDDIEHDGEALDYIRSEMLRHLDDIELGYFDDELDDDEIDADEQTCD